MDKPPRTFWQIWNMSFGFLGIQFGWGLQMANMSAIYEYLGARADQIPISVAGGAVDGIDRAADHRPGERPHLGPVGPAPSLLSGGRDSEFDRADPDAAQFCAVDGSGSAMGFSTLASTSAWSPFVRFVADLLPEFQRTRGFAMQSLFIGLVR